MLFLHYLIIIFLYIRKIYVCPLEFLFNVKTRFATKKKDIQRKETFVYLQIFCLAEAKKKMNEIKNKCT